VGESSRWFCAVLRGLSSRRIAFQPRAKVLLQRITVELRQTTRPGNRHEYQPASRWNGRAELRSIHREGEWEWPMVLEVRQVKITALAGLRLRSRPAPGTRCADPTGLGPSSTRAMTGGSEARRRRDISSALRPSRSHGQQLSRKHCRGSCASPITDSPSIISTVSSGDRISQRPLLSAEQFRLWTNASYRSAGIASWSCFDVGEQRGLECGVGQLSTRGLGTGSWPACGRLRSVRPLRIPACGRQQLVATVATMSAPAADCPARRFATDSDGA